jgi:hypothetical protein
VSAPERVSRRRINYGAHNVALTALGCASLALYFVGQRLAGGTQTISLFIALALLQCALHSVAIVIAWRARASRKTVAVVIIFAALFRLALVFEPPRLSDDIYRYVWDGRVEAAGINPYRYIPADPALAHLRDAAIYEHINRRETAQTIYPPLAQVVFLAATRVSESVLWMKLVLVAFEALALWAIAELLASFKLPRQRVIIAAWHPLVVWEIAGSGHVDALVICSVALALLARRRGRDTLTGALIACAALTKLFPVAIAPALYRRWSWRLPFALAATFVALYLPYLSVGVHGALGSLPYYADEEGLHTGTRFFLLALARKVTGVEIPTVAFYIFAFIALAALALWSLSRRKDDERSFVARALVLATAFTILFSPHFSWYFVWLIPLLALAPPALLVPVLYLTTANFVLYFTWLGDAPDRMLVINSIIYLPFAALCAATWLARRVKFGSAKASQTARGLVD